MFCSNKSALVKEPNKLAKALIPTGDLIMPNIMREAKVLRKLRPVKLEDYMGSENMIFIPDDSKDEDEDYKDITPAEKEKKKI